MSPEERQKRNERFRLRRERKKAMEQSVGTARAVSATGEPEAKIEVKESDGIVLIKNLLEHQNELLTKISKDLDFVLRIEKAKVGVD